jgi:hypothetical protein
MHLTEEKWNANMIKKMVLIVNDNLSSSVTLEECCKDI